VWWEQRTRGTAADSGGASASSSDVQNIVTTAVNSVNSEMVVAVVDRAGFVLGVFRTQNAPATTPEIFGQMLNANDVAVALARTGAFFSNDQAPLSSRHSAVH